MDMFGIVVLISFIAGATQADDSLTSASPIHDDLEFENLKLSVKLELVANTTNTNDSQLTTDMDIMDMSNNETLHSPQDNEGISLASDSLKSNESYAMTHLNTSDLSPLINITHDLSILSRLNKKILSNSNTNDSSILANLNTSDISSLNNITQELLILSRLNTNLLSNSNTNDSSILANLNSNDTYPLANFNRNDPSLLTNSSSNETYLFNIVVTNTSSSNTSLLSNSNTNDSSILLDFNTNVTSILANLNSNDTSLPNHNSTGTTGSAKNTTLDSEIVTAEVGNATTDYVTTLETVINDTVQIFDDADNSTSTTHSNGTTVTPHTSPTDEVACDLSSTEGHWMSNMFGGVEVTQDNHLVVNDGAKSLECHKAFRNGNTIFKTTGDEFSCVHFVKKNDNNVVMEIHSTGQEAEFPVTQLSDSPSTEEVLGLCQATKHDVILLRKDHPLHDVMTHCPSKAMGRFHTTGDDTMLESVAKATGTEGILEAVKDLNLFGTDGQVAGASSNVTSGSNNVTSGSNNVTKYCPDNVEICGDELNPDVMHCMDERFMPDVAIEVGCVGEMGQDVQLAGRVEGKEGLVFFCLTIKDTTPETIHIMQGECKDGMTGHERVLERTGQCPLHGTTQGSTTTEDDEGVADGGCSQSPNSWLMIVLTLAVTMATGARINVS